MAGRSLPASGQAKFGRCTCSAQEKMGVELIVGQSLWFLFGTLFALALQCVLGDSQRRVRLVRSA
jgi:hypothetical protein